MNGVLEKLPQKYTLHPFDTNSFYICENSIACPNPLKIGILCLLFIYNQNKTMLRLLLPLLFLISLPGIALTQSYKLVVYNIENLFDADGYAVFNDYKPFDRDGNPQYTPAHVLTKLQKASRLMARYGNGNGPDILVLSEMESDFTPLPDSGSWDIHGFLEKYSGTTIDRMLGPEINDDIRDLPSELLLLKAFEDQGLTGYDVAVAYQRDENGRPLHIQKNVIFSKLPIRHELTRAHPIEDARPILEVWLDVHGHDIIVFANHWKSRASDADIEKIRVQNAGVLKARLDEIRAEKPHADFILGGDFNSDYNQAHRYPYMEVTAVNHILKSTGDERKVKQGNTDYVYNLWYEHDITMRGSDTFRGYWGTLMQIMISPGMYDHYGIQYVDNSFDVGRFPGKNIYPNSGAPRRWHDFGTGGGYSDHLPISMKFHVVEDGDPKKRITLENPGIVDDHLWSPIPVTFTMPDSSDVLFPDHYSGTSIRQADYYDKLFYFESEITRNTTVTVNGEVYQLWSPVPEVREMLSEKIRDGATYSFIGRLGMFRGQWQFVIEDEIYINPQW